MKWWPKTQKAPEFEWLRYRFEPEPDITAFELALIWGRMSSGFPGGLPPTKVVWFREDQPPEVTFPPSVARHFKLGENQ